MTLSKPRSTNTPTLRFPQFHDEWVEKKLGEVGKFLGGGTPSSQNLEYWNGDIPWVSSSDLSDENINEIKITRFITSQAVQESATRLIPKDSVLIVSRVGVGKVVINRTDICTSQDFTNLIVENENNVFFAHLIKFKTNKLLEFNQGTSIKGFVKSDLENLLLCIPTLPEQTKIADFLTAVDERISTLKTKKSLLEKYKKGIMARIFSQKLRFRDDTSASLTTGDGKDYPDWVEKRLGECLDYIQPTKYLVSNTEYNDRFLIPVLTAGKTFILGYTDETEGIFENNLPVIIFDDFTTATQFVDFPFKAKSSAMKILVAKEGVSIRIMYEIIKYLKYEIGGHERHWISKFTQLDISLPSLPEQTKIANFLTSLDDQISLINEQISQSQTYKKGLLQKMFV